jgi:hypothetical protein
MSGVERRGVRAFICMVAAVSACAVTDRRPGILNNQSARENPTSIERDGAADGSIDADPATNRDAATDPLSVDPDPCVPASPPQARDPLQSMDSDDIEDIYLGLTQITLGASATTPTSDMLGLDLDGVCTRVADCPGADAAGSCRVQAKRVPTDGKGCRDNALSSLLGLADQITEIGTTFGLSDDLINCGLRAGAFNVLSRIQNYNGRRDDPHVRVDWYTAGASKQFSGASCTTELMWGPSALWEVDSKELTEPVTELARLPDSVVHDADAYVRDGVLVSRMPDRALLSLNGGGSLFTDSRCPPAVPSGSLAYQKWEAEAGL